MKNFKTIIMALVITGAVVIGFNFCSHNDKSAAALTPEMAMRPNPKIKNIIVMVSDGTSVDGITLARWYKSYNKDTGAIDVGTKLSLDELASGLVRTWWSDGNKIGAITDSAPGATAIATGTKTTDKYVGVNPEKQPMESVLSAAQKIGKATGLVATVNIQHATPAAFSANNHDRNQYREIGAQQISLGIDVVLGGGTNT